MDWYRKYKSMKRKYRELVNLRHLSIRDDIQRFEDRIAEHRQVQAETIADIEDHKLAMENELEKAQKMSIEIRSMDENIRNLLRDLKHKDVVLNVLIDHPKLRCRIPSKGYYNISCGQGASFILRRGQGIKYIPVRPPPGADFALRREIDMQISDLERFCRRFESLLP